MMMTAKQLLAEAIDADVAAVPDNAKIGLFERWDSLAHMRLVLAIEQRMQRQLDADEVVKIETVADIANLLQSAPSLHRPAASRS
jgi:acyl carrier protein